MLEKMMIGTVQFGVDYGVNTSTAKVMSQASCDEILDIACANQIAKLDTAEIYGDSIDKIGRYQKDGNKFEIISKFHIPENVYDTLSHSLSRLHIDSYHSVLAHRSEQIFTNRQVQQDLARLKSDGLTKYLGVSIYTNEEFAEAISNEYVDVIQFPYSLLDNINQRGELMKRAKDAGKLLHARSVYLQGMFLKEFPLPPKLKPLEVYIQTLRDLCTANNLTMTELALEYAFSNEMIDNVVVGHHTASQVTGNIAMIRNFKKGAYLAEVDSIRVKEAELLNPRNW